MNRKQRRQGGGRNPDGWWFVGFREVGPGVMMVAIFGPLVRVEVPAVLEHALMVDGFDGLYEWSGVPDATEVQQAVRSGKSIASLPGAARLILHPKHEKRPPKGTDSGTAEYIASTLGLDDEDVN